jgi:hypothetical protein
MYTYTITLEDQQTVITGKSIKDVLQTFFKIKGPEIILGKNITKISVQSSFNPDDDYTVNKQMLNKIIKQFKQQNTTSKQQLLCLDMKHNCPEGSKNTDPILMYEDWCDDIPFEEYVKNSAALSQCYRLSNLIQHFVSGLETTRNDNHFPQWPTDPYTRNPIAPEQLRCLYQQALDSKLEISEKFRVFISMLDKVDVKVAMEGPYIGLTDRINPKYVEKFVVPLLKLWAKSARKGSKKTPLGSGY